MSHFGRNIPNLAKFFRLKLKNYTRFITKRCCSDSVTCLSPPIRYRIENIIFRARNEEIISRSSAAIYQNKYFTKPSKFKTSEKI